MVGEGLCQTLIEGRVLHIDDNRPSRLMRDKRGKVVRLLLRWQRSNRDVSCAIGEYDQERLDIRVDELLVTQDVQSQQEPRRERRLAAHRNIGQGPLCQLHGVSGWQDQRGTILLEDYEPYAVAALVGIGQQRQDGALRCIHSLRDGHRPRRVHQKQHQIRHALNPDLALKIAGLDGECQPLTTLFTTFLVRGGGPKCGVESDIVATIPRGARLDIAAVLALRPRERSSAGMLASQPIEWGVQAPRLKGLAGLDLLTDFPPVGRGTGKYILFCGLGIPLLLALFALIFEL